MKKKELEFKAVYKANYPKVMRLCMGYVGGDKPLANDLTQEVFVIVWERLETFRNESAIGTWIYRIAINTCLTQLKKRQQTIRNYHLDRLEDMKEGDIKINREQMLSQMYACIHKLPETNKAIILLELEGLPQKKIADVMGLKHEAIRTRIHRIKKELTKCVHHE